MCTTQLGRGNTDRTKVARRLKRRLKKVGRLVVRLLHVPAHFVPPAMTHAFGLRTVACFACCLLTSVSLTRLPRSRIDGQARRLVFVPTNPFPGRRNNPFAAYRLKLSVPLIFMLVSLEPQFKVGGRRIRTTRVRLFYSSFLLALFCPLLIVCLFLTRLPLCLGFRCWATTCARAARSRRSKSASGRLRPMRQASACSTARAGSREHCEYRRIPSTFLAVSMLGS